MNRERIATLENEYLEEHPGTAGTVKPYVPENPEDFRSASDLPFPVLTDMLLSEEWEETDQTWFVDSSGFGSEGEAALTMKQFRKALVAYALEHPEHGYGLSGVGQFQVHVTAYRRK